MDIRLKVAPFDFDGKQFLLRCNMNVLAEVQELYGGDFSAALRSTSTLTAVNRFLTAMINDYAEEMGWETYTAKQVGRLLSTDPAEMRARSTMVMQLVRAALVSEDPEKN